MKKFDNLRAWSEILNKFSQNWKHIHKLTLRHDFRVWPACSRTAKAVMADRHRRSRHTPSNFRQWSPIREGNCQQMNLKYETIVTIPSFQKDWANITNPDLTDPSGGVRSGSTLFVFPFASFEGFTSW